MQVTTPEPAVPEATERNPWVVLGSTSLAVFAVFLDTTILFVAFPSISESFSSPCAVDAVVGPQRLHDHVRRLADPRRSPRRPGRAAQDLPRRRRRLHHRVDAVRPRSPCRVLIAPGCFRPSPRPPWCRRRSPWSCRRSRGQKIPVAVAIWGAVGAVAGAAGPTLGALVVENLGWRWAFYINLPVGIISFFLGRRVLPEGREAEPRPAARPDGRRLLASGLAAGRIRASSRPTVGMDEPEFAGAELVAVGSDRLVRAPLRQGGQPGARPAVVRVATSAGQHGACSIYAIGFTAMFLGNVLFLTGVWHYSILRAGWPSRSDR